jgi:L-amino acid N-acyltransferase YncA
MSKNNSIEIAGKNFIHALIRFGLGLKRPSKRFNRQRLKQRGETIDDIKIREVTLADVPALAALHVQAWSETHWNVKKPPTYEVREHQWRQQFKVKDGSWFCFVAENSKGELVGFAKGMNYASIDLPDYSGELNKIYLLLPYQRLGIGQQLFCHVVQKFLCKGISAMVLFGVPQNPSCAFHEAMGGERLIAKNGEFHGGYGWRDLGEVGKSGSPRSEVSSQQIGAMKDK